MSARPRTLLKYLRIVWMASCIVLCISLVLLWVRSYWRMDSLLIMAPHRVPCSFLSWGGELEMTQYGGPATSYSYQFESEIQRYKATLPRPFNILGFRWSEPNGTKVGFATPWWFLVVLNIITGVFPWISWSARFNLRVLLLSLTLLVLVLTLVSFSYHAALRQERIYRHSIGEV